MTFLTAYLDEALDPEQRSRVESALLSDPRLADQLRELTTVHGLLAGLSRPALDRDLSGRVLTQIGGRAATGQSERDRPTLPRLLRKPAGRAAVLLATAATFLAVASATVIGTVLRSSSHLGPSALVAQGASSVPDGGRLVHAPVPERSVPSPPVPPPTEPDRVSGGATASARSELVAAPDARERRRDLDAQGIRRLLDSPSLRKVFVVTDVIGGTASNRVGDILSRTPRKYSAYVCLTIGADEPIDPDHPGAASVFAVVVDPSEQSRLREALEKDFAGKLTETEPRPETLTMLADVGQIAVLPGTGLADLIVPEEPRLALTTPGTSDIAFPAQLNRDPGAVLTPPRPPALAGENPRLHSEPVASRPPDSPNHRSDGELDRPDASSRHRPASNPRPGRAVVLVWVQHGPSAAGRSTR